MAAPLDKKEYPQYFIADTVLLAFVAPDKMYKIEPIGSNKNPGVTIDHYITRNMVLKHFGTGKRVSRDFFKSKLEILYSAYIQKITENE